MKNVSNFQILIWVGLVLALAGTLFAQSSSDKVLVINGKTVDSGLIQIGGRSYVDVETLAQLTNGSFVVDPHRVVLNIPVGNAPAATPAVATAPVASVTVPATAAPAAAATVPVTAAPAAKTAADPATAEVTAPNGGAPASASAAAAANEAAAETAAPAPPAKGISRQFASVAIATLADMREWRGAISAMISHGLAVSDAWAAGYRDQAQADLAQAEVAATTDDDRSALQLLRNEESNLESWWNTVLGHRQDLNGSSTIDPDALKNDPMLAKIRSCSQFLNPMLVSGAFSDNSACH
ncbi:MAG TPA: hypothetical protein VN875_06615 [Candidatus Binatus sp.]|nr:hypothetical protein [Candidatus Binatus sp.]